MKKYIKPLSEPFGWPDVLQTTYQVWNTLLPEGRKSERVRDVLDLLQIFRARLTEVDSAFYVIIENDLTQDMHVYYAATLPRAKQIAADLKAPVSIYRQNSKGKRRLVGKINPTVQM